MIPARKRHATTNAAPTHNPETAPAVPADPLTVDVLGVQMARPAAGPVRAALILYQLASSLAVWNDPMGDVGSEQWDAIGDEVKALADRLWKLAGKEVSGCNGCESIIDPGADRTMLSIKGVA